MAHIRPELLLLAWGCGGPEPTPPAPTCEATWETFGEAWFRSWCTSCHTSSLPEADRFGAPIGVDFDTLEGVRAFELAIRAAALGDGSTMPPGGGPTAQDRAELEAWLDCGQPGEGEPAAPGCEAAELRAGDLRVETGDDPCAGGPIELEGTLEVLADAELRCLCAVGGDLVVGPGARRVLVPELRELGGGLRLREVAALEELDVRSLLSVGGDLVGADLPALLAWRTGALREVGGDFRLERLPLLDEVDLSRLASVGGDLVLDDLAAVQVLQGEGYALRSVGGDLVLRGMPSWKGFYGFGQLLEVPGDLVVAADAGLTRLDGFTSLLAVGGSLELTGNDALMRLDGFDRLARVGGDLVLAHNRALEAEDAFAMLTEVGGAVRLEENPTFVVRGGLTRITSVGALVVDGLPATPVLGISALARCDGALVLRRSGVVSFARPAGLSAVGGDLVIEENPRLAELPGWAALGMVGGDLVVTGNPSLPAAEATELATGIGTVGGAVDVGDNGP